MTPAERAAALVTQTEASGHFIVRIGRVVVAVLHDAGSAETLVAETRMEIAAALWDEVRGAGDVGVKFERERVVGIVEAHRDAWKQDPTPRGLGHREAASMIAARIHGAASRDMSIAPPEKPEKTR